MIIITLSKVAAIKFLTEEGVACEIEDDPWYNVERLNCAATVCKTVLGEGGGGKGISESRLVHILHNDTKICVDPQIQRSLGLFANVIFLSQNFILTIMMHRESHLILNFKKPSVKPDQVISFDAFPRISTGALFYNFGWEEGRLLEGGHLIKEALINKL